MGEPRRIFGMNCLQLSIMRWYIASGEMSSGMRFALTMSALSLLTEYRMAFAPCAMGAAFAIISGCYLDVGCVFKKLAQAFD